MVHTQSRVTSAADPTTRAYDVALPALSDRFTVERCLGQGATGVVYAARDERDGSRVALKTLLHMTPMGIYRLKQEFRGLASLSHPNFVSLYELISTNGMWFITMELVDGIDFITHCRDAGQRAPTTSGAPSKGETHEALRSALAQLADAISALHDAGRVHLDLKPSNVLVDRAGRIVVLDFELAREREERAAEIFDGRAFVGTPAFVAPEVVQGRAPSPASDWYAFGTMLYVALSGEQPFCGEPSRMLIRKCTSDPEPPHEIDPSSPRDLSDLCMSLLSREPAARPSGQQVLRRLGATAARWSVPSLVTSMSTPPPRLVGRDTQLAELWRQYEACRGGQASTVWVYGQSGMGKTVLARAFLERLRHSETALILTGRCYERESVPFKAFDPVIDALCRHLARLPEVEIAALIPPQVAVLARVFPVFASVHAQLGSAPDSDTRDVQELRRLAFDSLRQLLVRLAAQHPVVLWIDDLQWGDRDSALLLSAILRPPSPPRLLFIGSCRLEDQLGDFMDAYQELPPGGARSSVLHVGPLDRADALMLTQALMAKETSERDPRVDSVTSQCDGNPFFLTLLAREVDQQGPVPGLRGELTLEQVILARVARLPALSQSLMAVIAVAARPLPQRVAVEAAGLGSQEAAALATLRVAHLARSYRDREVDVVCAYHDRIAETIVDNMAAGELCSHHARLAAALEQTAHPDLETLVAHHRGAGNIEKAAEYAVLAADQAARTLAFDQAARFYRLALDLGARGDAERERLGVKLGDALANAGHGQEAAHTYLDVARTASHYLAVELTRRAGEQLLRNGHIDEGLTAIGQVLDELDIRRARTPTRAALFIVWRRLATRVRGLSFVERDESEISQADLTGIDVCWSATVVTGMVDTVRGAEMQARHLPLALRLGEPYRVCRALCVEAAHAATEGERSRPKFERLIALASGLAERVRHPHATGLTELVRAMGSWLFGSWSDTVRLAEQAERTLRERCRGVAWEIGTAQICSARALTMLGRVSQLCTLAARNAREARDRGDRYSVWANVAGWPVVGRIAVGEAEAVRRELADVHKAWSRSNFSVQDHWATLGDSLLDVNCGMAERAFRRMADAHEPQQKALLYRVQTVRIDARFVTANAGLALAAQTKHDPRTLARVHRLARQLQDENVHWCTPLAQLVFASVAHLQHDRQRAMTMLTAASAAFEQAEMLLMASLTQRRLGQTLQGEEGRTLIIGADERLRQQGVADIEALARTLTPAFED